MWVLQNRKHRIKTRRLIQLNFNKTGVFNVYKFMTVLKSEIYTNDLLSSKKFFLPKFKKRSSLIAKLFDKFILKVN